MDIFEFYQVTDFTDCTIEAKLSADDLLTEIKNNEPTVNSAEVLRIEANLTGNWKGVRGCCDQSTVDSNAQRTFDTWIKDQLFQNTDLVCLRYGHNGGKARCGNSGGDWGTPRRCVGSITINAAFIEFMKR